jgi:transcriptional regulator with XRE-family HTH domain
MDFHKRLRRLRTEKKLSYQAIATVCGVSWQTVQQWCADDGTLPKIENLEPLARLLECTPWYLLWGVEVGGNPPDTQGKPSLSDEAEELLKQVVRLDKAGPIAHKTFALYKGLLLLFPYTETSEDDQAGHSLLGEIEQEAHEVLARDRKSGEHQDAGTTRNRSRHREIPTTSISRRGK